MITKSRLAFVFILLSMTSGESCYAAGGAPLGLMPSRWSGAVGLNVRTKEFYSQETYLQESWLIAAGAHWSTGRWESDLFLRTSFEKFQELPNSKRQLEMTSRENRLGLEAGVEASLYLPAGVSLGVVRIAKTTTLQSGDYVLVDATNTDLSESLWVPSFRLWVGVPMLPRVLQFNIGIQQVFMSRPKDETFNYGGELRYEF